ncbi:MAG: Type 1 glutamine amidotransferase-like domain-containing protein [Sphingobacterium sp.]
MKYGSAILLTSTGLSSTKVLTYVNKYIAELGSFPECIIVSTASENTNKNKYVKLAIEQFRGLGVAKISTLDILEEDIKKIRDNTILYVSGGNSFRLLDAARKKNFRRTIETVLSKNGIYIGVSAGSVILGKDTRVALDVYGDDNDIGLTDFTGLGFEQCMVCPHYTKEIRPRLEKYANDHKIKIISIADDNLVLLKVKYVKRNLY